MENEAEQTKLDSLFEDYRQLDEVVFDIPKADKVAQLSTISHTIGSLLETIKNEHGHLISRDLQNISEQLAAAHSQKAKSSAKYTPPRHNSATQLSTLSNNQKQSVTIESDKKSMTTTQSSAVTDSDGSISSQTGANDAMDTKDSHQKSDNCDEKATESVIPTHAISRAKLLYWLGHFEKISDRLSEASALLIQSIKLDPTIVDAWNVLGLVYQSKKEWMYAKCCYESALEYLPNKLSYILLSKLLRSPLPSASNEDARKYANDSLAMAKEGLKCGKNKNLIKDGELWFSLGNAYLTAFWRGINEDMSRKRYSTTSTSLEQASKGTVRTTSAASIQSYTPSDDKKSSDTYTMSSIYHDDSKSTHNGNTNTTPVNHNISSSSGDNNNNNSSSNGTQQQQQQSTAHNKANTTNVNANGNGGNMIDNNHNNHNNGLSLLKHEFLDKCLHAYKYAQHKCTINPHTRHPDLFFNRSIVYAHYEQYSEALEDLIQAKKFGDEFVDAKQRYEALLQKLLKLHKLIASRGGNKINKRIHNWKNDIANAIPSVAKLITASNHFSVANADELSVGENGGKVLIVKVVTLISRTDLPYHCLVMDTNGQFLILSLYIVGPVANHIFNLCSQNSVQPSNLMGICNPVIKHIQLSYGSKHVDFHTVSFARLDDVSIGGRGFQYLQ